MSPPEAVACSLEDIVNFAFLLVTSGCFVWVFGAPFWRKKSDD